MFAVIKTGGKQYSVTKNDCLVVEKLEGGVGDSIVFDSVLALVDGNNFSIGSPFVESACVVAKIVEQGRHPTVIAFKKRRRQNSRRKRGNRQFFTKVCISEIQIKKAS